MSKHKGNTIARVLHAFIPGTFHISISKNDFYPHLTEKGTEAERASAGQN